MDIFGLEGIIDHLGDGLDKLFTSDKERADAKITLERIKLQPQILHLLTNLEESKDKRLFVSGWRPFVGWICGLGFTYDFLIKPILSTIGLHAPVIDTQVLMNLVMRILS